MTYEVRGWSATDLIPEADDERALLEALDLANRHGEAKRVFRWDDEGIGWRRVALVYPERIR